MCIYIYIYIHLSLSIYIYTNIYTYAPRLACVSYLNILTLLLAILSFIVTTTIIMIWVVYFEMSTYVRYQIHYFSWLCPWPAFGTHSRRVSYVFCTWT